MFISGKELIINRNEYDVNFNFDLLLVELKLMLEFDNYTVSGP